MNLKIFKSASLSPERIKAGDSDEFIIKLVIGEAYTSQESRIVFDFSSTLGTSPPTRQMNEMSGYVESYVNNPTVEFNLRVWDVGRKYFVDKEHPNSRESARVVVLDLSPGLKENDIVEIHWGETLGGFGPGAKVSSVVPRPDYKARIDVRYFDSQEKGMPDYCRDYEGYKRPVPDEAIRLEYAITPRETRRLRLLRKHDSAILVPYDVFWNVSSIDNLEDIIEYSDKPVKNKYGTFDFENKNVNIVSKKISITESAEMDNVFQGMNIYWGDLHTHSAYSLDCVSNAAMDMSPDDLMKFAKYRAGLDFFAVTDHHLPYWESWNKIGKKEWLDTLKAINKNHEDGKFVVFSGIELSNDYGDICLIFKDAPNYDEIMHNYLKYVSDFYAQFGKNMMAIPHFHGPGRRPEGTWREGMDDICHVLEVYSDHGSYEREDIFENGRAWCKPFRADRCAAYFLKQGYKYGFAANSDDHKGHVGVSGLTAVFAKELSREAIFEAYQKRHVYGTTNARIKLIFTANSKLMGSTIPVTEDKEFMIDVVGENTLKKVELFRNAELHKQFIPDGKKFKTEFKIKSSQPDNWYVRVTQVDNHIAWSSPVWFE